MTLSDLEWSFHALCAISVLAELLVIVWFQRVHCIKHTHRHRHTHRHTQTHKQTHSIIIIISALLVAKWKYIGQGEFVSTSPGIFKTFHYGVFVI